MNSDGNNFEQPPLFEKYRVTEDARPYLAWSPDGRYFAFEGADEVFLCPIPNSDCVLGSNWGIYLADLTEGSVITVTYPRIFWTNPSWAPDSQHLAVALQVQNSINLFNFDVKMGEMQQLTTDASSDIYPSWSPDGQWIAFVRYVPKPPDCNGLLPEVSKGCNHASLYLIRPDGTGLKLLTENVYLSDSPYNSPSWSPDSHWLALAVGDQQPDVVAINVDSGESRILENSPANDLYPMWSPEGRYVAFVSERDGSKEIYVVSSEGTGTINLTQDPADDSNPVWSPSGNQIAFLSDREELGIFKLYVMSTDGTGLIKLSDYYLTTRPAWSPVMHP